MIRVSGWSRVPEPPARMTPFIAGDATRRDERVRRGERAGRARVSDAGERDDETHRRRSYQRRLGSAKSRVGDGARKRVRFSACRRGPAARASPCPPRADGCSRRRRRSTSTRSSSISRTGRRGRRQGRAARGNLGAAHAPADARRPDQRRSLGVVARRSRRARRARPTSIVVPKVEGADDVDGGRRRSCRRASGSRCRSRRRAGSSRSSASPQPAAPLEALVFGPGDFAASLGVPVLTIGAGAVRSTRSQRIVVAARAFGLQAVDGPYAVLDDDRGAAGSRRERALALRLRRQMGRPSRLRSRRVARRSSRRRAEERRPGEAHPRGGGRRERASDGEMVDAATKRLAEGVIVARRAAFRALTRGRLRTAANQV